MWHKLSAMAQMHKELRALFIFYSLVSELGIICSCLVAITLICCMMCTWPVSVKGCISCVMIRFDNAAQAMCDGKSAQLPKELLSPPKILCKLGVR